METDRGGSALGGSWRPVADEGAPAPDHGIARRGYFFTGGAAMLSRLTSLLSLHFSGFSPATWSTK